MGALANVRDTFKESKIGLMLRDVYTALSVMVNSVGDEEQTVKEAVQATIKESNGNPVISKELNKFVEIDEINRQVLEEKASKQFDFSNTFGGREITDEDGFFKIENKLGNIKTKVSGNNAIGENTERGKGGNQKSRVDD